MTGIPEGAKKIIYDVNLYKVKFQFFIAITNIKQLQLSIVTNLGSRGCCGRCTKDWMYPRKSHSVLVVMVYLLWGVILVLCSSHNFAHHQAAAQKTDADRKVIKTDSNFASYCNKHISFSDNILVKFVRLCFSHVNY
jgi:hypothetical protein